MPIASNPGAPGETALSVALLGPDEQRRQTVVSVLSKRPGLRLTEFSSFPSKLDDLPQMLAQSFDVVVIDADSEPEYAFAVAENICANSQIYVMAYSAKADMKQAVNFMRVGVREFFPLPLDPVELAAALGRAESHRTGVPVEEKKLGKVFAFLGTKGGCGTTTLASNFALALAQESEGSTLLIDLGQPLGDAAIHLGMVTDYSVATALQYPNRLDASLLSTLVAKHATGLTVLAAPSELPDEAPTKEAVDRLIEVTREIYDFIVVDAGSRVDLMNSNLFDESATIYLIAQVGISELRNAHCMIVKHFGSRGDSLQVVLNRYKPNDLLFDDAQVARVLNRPAQWKVPDDYAAARRTREHATPMVMVESAISQTIRNWAKSAAGVAPEKSGKKGFFRFLR